MIRDVEECCGSGFVAQRVIVCFHIREVFFQRLKEVWKWLKGEMMPFWADLDDLFKN